MVHRIPLQIITEEDMNRIEAHERQQRLTDIHWVVHEEDITENTITKEIFSRIRLV
jgi:hypothetical protein